jgi:uncharacterized protein (TIGR02231 family)
MIPFTRVAFNRLALTLAGLAVCIAAPAQTSGAAASRVTQVTLYPGIATVERVARVAAGARQLQLICLPASFDTESLRLEGDPGITIGEVNARTMPRNRAPGCEKTALDKRIAALEDQVAAVDAETGGNDLALGYLKGLGQGAAPVTGNRPAAGPAISETVQAVRGTGQATLLQQHQLVRRKEALQAQLDPLIADRDRLQRVDAPVRNVTINLNATVAGDIRLRYQVTGPGWAPSYRASLDTRSGAIRIERLAQVGQASGEDWTGVRLRLSTGQPRAAVAGPTPQPWTVQNHQPTPVPTSAMVAMAPAPAGAPASAREADEAPRFDVSVFQGMYATEFEVPGTVDLVSGEQRLTLSLGTQDLAGTVRTRTTPALETNAYLVADIQRPTGVWPAGSLQLYRDGTLVGTTRWTVGADERITLPFGRDELVRVQSEPQRAVTGTATFIGGKVERRIARAYSVQNLHNEAIQLEVLEATPVSGDEAIVVTQRLSPQPATTEWNKQPGVAQWLATLEPGATARFTADYTATAPKEFLLGGWR